jgi:LacI family transcriptional regulator
MASTTTSTSRTTIRAVAREAGVSPSTVSNVLNGRHAEMAAETLARVQTAMDRLGYRPNRLARSLATRRTATVGLIVGDLTNALYPPVLFGAEAVCRAADHSLLLANAPDLAHEREAVQAMRDAQVDGLILFSVSYLDLPSTHLLQINASDTPVVVINRWLREGTPLASVAFDHREGGRLATQHLLDLGHRRIAHLAGPAVRLTGVERRLGYLDALSAAGLVPAPDLIRDSDYGFESGYRLFCDLWRQTPRPTALFAGGDTLALGALRAAHELGVRVPADLSLVAFGNPDAVQFATPGVSTIDLPVAEAGRTAAELLLARIERLRANGTGSSAAPERRVLAPTLLVRETTAPPAT